MKRLMLSTFYGLLKKYPFSQEIGKNEKKRKT